jgi:hypothetical protein
MSTCTWWFVDVEMFDLLWWSDALHHQIYWCGLHLVILWLLYLLIRMCLRRWYIL